LQYIAGQCVAVCCSVLQCVSALPGIFIAETCNSGNFHHTDTCAVAYCVRTSLNCSVCCSVLQCVAVRCSALQCIATLVCRVSSCVSTCVSSCVSTCVSCVVLCVDLCVVVCVDLCVETCVVLCKTLHVCVVLCKCVGWLQLVRRYIVSTMSCARR